MATRNEIKRKVEMLRQAALQGDGEASWELGCLFEDGVRNEKGVTVVRRDLKRALAAYRRAARLGSAYGIMALGYWYDTGTGMRQDKRRALECYTRAWRLGKHAEAASNIATLYRDRCEHGRAFRWWQRAAHRGYGDALVDIGYVHYYGIGVRRDPFKAMKAFRRAARARFITEWGREEALYHLAVAHIDRGGPGDQRLAGALLRRANQDGDYPEASALATQLRTGATPALCRCRRWLWRSIPGQAECTLHKSPANQRMQPMATRLTRRG